MALAAALCLVSTGAPVLATTDNGPSVKAGSDQTITLPANATLTGSAKSDGRPLTFKWTERSGEGDVTFSSSTSATTTASFSRAGTYTLRLTANDGRRSGYDELVVTVRPAVTNQAPTVNAGANQTITLPASATLSGQVSDDGRPAGSKVTSLWKSVSGPGSVAFASATTPATTATFSKAGTYSLQLKATDGDKSAEDSVTITVLPERNDAPVVNAGVNQTIVLPAGVTLTGTVRDDGLPAGHALTVKWTEQQGEGQVTFASSTSATTTATFSRSGTYVLRLTASDGRLSTYDDVVVTVQSPPRNDAPEVFAGFPQIIRLPDTANLRGRVSDDGRPAGSKVTSLWKTLFGPAPVVFANSGNPVTTARFSRPGLYLLLLFATDGDKSSVSPVIIKVLRGYNDPPSVDAGPDQSIVLPANAVLSGSVDDDSPLTLAWTKRSGEGNVTFASPTSATTTASFSRAGTYVLRLTASDGRLTGFDELTVTVAPAGPGPNQAPVVNAGADQAITLPSGASLSGVATDDGQPAGSTLSTQWSVAEGGVVTFANASALNTTATFTSPGTYTLRLTATDGALSSSDTVTIVVTDAPPPPNQAPVVNAGADQSITLPSGAALGGSATDDGLPAGSTLTTQWSVDGGGSVAFANASSLTTTATFSGPGTYTLRLTATDGSLSSSDTVTIVVADVPPPPNQAPVANAGVDQAITLPSGAVLSGSATDDGLPAGSTLTTQWSVDGGGSVTFADASSLTTTATFAGPGSYTLRLTATDGSLSSSDTVTIVVADVPPPPNQAPVVNAGADQSITLPSGASLNGTASDDGLPTGSTLATQWSVDGGGAVTFADASSRTTTASFAAAGTYTLRLTATDGSLSSSDTLTIVVADAPPPPNQAPVVNAGADQSITLPSGAPLSGTASDDGRPAGSTLATQWSVESGGAVTFADASSPMTTATFAAAGTYVLRLTATDGALSTSDSLTVIVAAAPVPNQPPVVNAGPDQTVSLGTELLMLGTASDDGLPAPPTFTVQWTRENGPAAVTFANAAAASTSATFTQTGTYVLRLTASDGPRSTSDTVTVIVTPAPVQNLAPVVNAGSDQSVTLPGTAALSGAVSDDGKPAGSTLLAQWSLDNGPAPVAFANAASSTTTATFTIEGTYVLRLAASDGTLSTFDTITVVVSPAPPPANLAPTVNAGLDRTIAFPINQIDLAGTATDDGLPAGSSLALQWTKDSGVGGVVFGAPASLGTTATFDQPGTYVLRLTANDSALTGFDTLTVIVNPPANQAPVVDAGADRSITLPINEVALTGSATDDGLPAASSLTFRWSVLNGPTVPAFADATVRDTTVTFPVAGTYLLRLTATDGDRAAFDDLSVVVNPGEPPPPPANRAPVAHAGGPYTGDATSALGLTAAGSTDPDGDTLTYQWTFGDSQSGSGRTPTHTWATAGVFTVTVTVTDGRGGSTSATTQATIGPPVDRAPPSVQLRAPAQVLPGETFTATADAADNVAVTGVTFEVNAANPSNATAAPYQRQITAPPLAAPGTTIALRATARDAAGNTGVGTASVLVTAAPDTEPPSLTLQAPAETAAGSQVLVTAQAADNVGVVSVTFALASQSLGADQQAPYEGRYTVPAGTPVGTTLTFTARAIDAAGNATTRAASVQVIAAPDTTPPTITLTAPAETSPGATITISATAADNAGVAGVQFFADEVPLGADAMPPYSITLPIASNRPNGSVIRTRAVATDFSGLTAASSAETVVRVNALGAGMVFGEVYDDATGLPIAGVQVAIEGTDAGGAPYLETATTDPRGRYVVQGREGAARVTLTKAGWTSVVRAVVVPGNRAVEAIDARLTAVGDPIAIAAVLGRTFESIDTRLEVAGGALTADTTLRVTRVSSQGLAGLLPRGWSPIASLDVAPAGIDFTAPAILSARKTVTLPAATPVAVLAWDAAEAGWRVIAMTTAGVPTATLDASIERTTAIVWAIADVAPAAPPAAVVGDLLAGVDALEALDASATVQVTPQPNILVYQPGVRSQVGGVLTNSQPVSSGVVLRANLRERYEFFSNATTIPDPFQHDVVFYQFGGAAASLSAPFVVSPSITFEPAFLRQGVIAVEVIDRGESEDAAVIGADGGTASSATGESVTVPAGALAAGVPVTATRVTEAESGMTLPAPLEFVAAANVSFSGAALTSTATLAVPRPSGLFNDHGLLLLRVIEIDGATRLLLTGLGRIAGERIVSDISVPGVATPLEGVRAGGRYIFARITAPFGFVTGIVRGTTNAPFGGALISSSTIPTVALSQADGQYVTVALSGPAAIVALDVARRDTGGASGVLTAGGILRVDLRIALDPPRVTSVTPSASAVSVPLASPIVVSFSEPIDPASISALRVETGGAPVAGSVVLSDNNRIATFRATAAFASATSYTVRVTTTLTDLSGRTLENEFTSAFTSLNTAPPPLPPAGAISTTLPGADGLSTVSGTQGSAGLHDTVDVVNVTRKTSARALVNPNGSFQTTIGAGLGDRLQVVITNQGGGQTVVTTPPFARTNADGSRSVVTGSEGGRLEGPSGIVVDVPQGAFPDGTLVTMRYVDEASFPIPLTADQRALFAFSGGVQLDFGGATPQQYLNVSLPASPGDRQTDRWVVGAVHQLNGQLLLNAVDTARVIDGRIMTASPPCPGVLAAATYGYIKSTTQPLGVIYGRPDPYFGMVPHTIQLNNPFVLGVLAMPWITIPTLNAPTACFPILMSRTTVTPNAQRIAIRADQFTPASREVLIENLTSGARLNFPRNVVEYRFPVTGTTDHTYITTVVTAQGDRVVPHEVSPGMPGYTVVRLDMDTISAAVSEVVIRNISTSPVVETHFAQNTAVVEIPVSGGANDSYSVNIRDENGALVAAQFELRSPNGQGNLVARVLPVTIDPGTHVSLINVTQGSAETPIPEELIEDGGFIYPFSAPVTDRFGLRVDYPDGRFDVTGIPAVRIVVRSPDTGRVIRTIDAPVPPFDEPSFNLGSIGGDTDPPRIVSSPGLLSSFDPSTPLSFTFSEGIDRYSALNGLRLLSPDGSTVSGEVRLSSGNTVVTFVPNAPLKLGVTYRLEMRGLTDGSGNEFRDFNLTLTTFVPQKMNPTPLGAGTVKGTVRDIAYLSVPQVNGPPRRFGYQIIDDGNVAYLVTLDVTNPEAPVQLHSQLGGNSNITVVTGIQNMALRAPSACNGATTFSGNLAITSNYTGQGSALQFWDLTSPFQPCMMGSKSLTISGALSSGSSGAVVATGRARRVAAVKTPTGVIAYVAVEETGLMMVDVGANSPSLFPNGVREPLAAGNYTDVVDTGTALIAAERTANRIDIFDTSLTLLHEIDLTLPGAEALSLALGRGWGIDDNQNGVIEAIEQRDLVFVGTSRGVVVVDITDLDSPWVRGAIPMQGTVFRIAVDVEHRRLYTGGARVLYGNDWAISVIDLGALTSFETRDDDQDGLDDRILWQPQTGYRYQRHGYRAMVFDEETRTLVVGLEAQPGETLGYDVWNVINICCDLGVAMRAPPAPAASGDRELVIVQEKRALQKGLAAGLAAAQSCGVPIRTGLPITFNSISIIEQGSGACLWKDNPVADCSSAYQPGLSDHDYEVFVPRQFLPGNETSGGACVIKALNRQFTDANQRPIPIDIGNGETMSFKDITFFPVEKESFEDGRLNTELPRQAGNDPTGDFGLGRQQLLLKWVLEGEYVELPGYHVTGRPLEDIMTELRVARGIRQLEGQEWGLLQRFNLTKSKAFLRIQGASHRDSAFHEFFISQLHDAGKTGIRAALARMVAHERANQVVLDVSRGTYQSSACLSIDPARPPATWTSAPCRSFEEYVASAAGRTVQRNLGLFTAQEASEMIYRFFEVKADQGERITTDEDADRFIGLAARFIDRVIAETQQIYDDTIANDPDVTQRTENRTVVLSKTASALAGGKVQIVPQVFQHGFNGAGDVAFSMYRQDSSVPAGTPLKTIRISLAPNETRHLNTGADAPLPEMADGLSEEDRNLNDLASGSDSTDKPLFMLGAGTPENPYIDFGGAAGQLRYVAFTIDLPEKKMKEANRHNNHSGFYFYVLDRSEGALPPPAATVPLPIDNLDGSMLLPDTTCVASADVQVTQEVRRSSQGNDANPVSDWVVAQPGEVLTFRVTVRNNSTQDVADVRVCNSIAPPGSDCVDIGTLGAAQSVSRDFAHTVSNEADGEYRNAVPSAEAPTIGIVTGLATRIIVSCDDMTLVPAPGNPNPDADDDAAKVMRGGKAIRHFRLVRRGGSLAGREVRIEVTVPGRGAQILTFVTDANGELTRDGQASSGIVIDVDLALPADAVITGRLLTIDGISSYCDANTVLFTIVVADRTWTKTWNAGSRIDFQGTLEAGLNIGTGSGFSFKIEEAAGKGRQKLTFGRTADRSIGTVLAAGKTGFKGFVLGAGVQAGASFEATGKYVTTDNDEHEFTYQPGQTDLAQAESAVLGGLMLSTVVSAQPMVYRLADKLNPFFDAAPFRVGESASHTLEAQVDAEASVQAGWFPKAPNPMTQKSKVKFGLEASASGAAGLGATLAFDNAYREQELTTSLGVFGSANINLALGLGPGEYEADPETGDKKLKLLDALRASLDGSIAGGIKFGVTLDKTSASTVKKLTIAISQEKSYGWKVSQQIDGLKEWINIDSGGSKQPPTTFEISITDPAAIKRIADAVASYGEMAGSFVSSIVVPGSTPMVSPSLLVTQLVKLFDLMMTSDATFTRTVEIGSAVKLPSGAELGLAGVSAEVFKTLNADRSISFTEATGVIRNGHMYELAQYDRSLYPTFGNAQDEYREIGRIALTAALDLVVNSVDVVTTVFSADRNAPRSNHTAQLEFSGAGETPFTPQIASWTWEPGTTETGLRVQRPIDYRGPVDGGHYGVGGFHQFLPADKRLLNPGTLTFFYRDDEVTGIDESQLGIYRWNEDRADWDYLGGTPDPAANTVTTTVDRFALYTMAPPIPAGTITLSASWVGGGTQQAPTTTATYTSDTLRLNTGAVVPDGTLYTVAPATTEGEFIPLGTVLTADADPSTPGTQVAAAGGTLQFTVLYPSAAGSVRPFVFSKAGTALASTVIAVRPE